LGQIGRGPGAELIENQFFGRPAAQKSNVSLQKFGLGVVIAVGGRRNLGEAQRQPSGNN